MGGRGRPSQCIISEDEFRDLLLDKLVTYKGEKVGLRKVFGNEEFMKQTGYYHLETYKATQQYRMISPGSIAYIIKKLNLYEWEVYSHHKFITHRVPLSKSFEEFSSERNRGYKEMKFGSVMERQNSLKQLPKDKLAWVLNSMSKHIEDYPEIDKCFANKFMDYTTLEDYSDRLRRFIGNDYEYLALMKKQLASFRVGYLKDDDI